MSLPVNGSQDELIRSVARVNKQTVVVNSTGSPITMSWLQDVAAVVQAWFPGQEAGHAIADVLLGAVNPGGKLPVTFPKTIEAAPTCGNFPYTGDLRDLHVDYVEDIFIGYKHYDTASTDSVFFPFDYGLSYTTFEIADIKISQTQLSPSDTLNVSATIRNTGSVAGSQTLQVYVGPKDGQQENLKRAQKVLAGFIKARDIQAGQVEEVSVNVDVRQSFAYWNEDKYSWVVPRGTYVVNVGTSSAQNDIEAKIDVEVTEEGIFGP